MAGSVGQTTIGILPWMGYKSVVGTWQRENISSYLGMGHVDNTSANQNDEINWDVYLDSGTWKVAFLTVQDTGRPIYTVTFDGAAVGTIDTYNAANTPNVYQEITGFVNATPKVGTLKVKYATKNASSTGYTGRFHSIALIKTAGAHSTPNGTDTPGYTWMYLPWMGVKAHTNWETRDQGSALLGGGWLRSSGAQNDEISWDVWLDAGTYKCALIYRRNSDAGVFSIQLDGVEKGTVDSYNAAFDNNNYSEVGSIAVASAGVKTFKLKMATKNASSSNYAGNIQSVAWIRTGA